MHKGDVLIQIARSEYPQLSQWSAIEIVAFINDLNNPKALRPNQKLKIYEYEIVKDEQAPWAETNSPINR